MYLTGHQQTLQTLCRHFSAKTFYIFMLARTVLKQQQRDRTSEHKQDLTRPLTLSKNSFQSNWLCWLNGGKAKAYMAQNSLRPCVACGAVSNRKPANILWPIQFPPEGNFRLAYDRRGCHFATGQAKRVAFPLTLCLPGERLTETEST